MKPKPRRNVGEIGPFRVTVSSEGTISERIPANIPPKKESAEAFFVNHFIQEYNLSEPLGRGYPIFILRQNDTADLDFDIFSPRANKLELAEITPLSQPFGQSAEKGAQINVHEYASWIFGSIIAAKEKSYRGRHLDLASIMLALYVTHDEFLPNDSVIDCLRQLCREYGATFEAIFVLTTNGIDLRILNLIHPFPLSTLPPSAAYKELAYYNLTNFTTFGPGDEFRDPTQD